MIYSIRYINFNTSSKNLQFIAQIHQNSVFLGTFNDPGYDKLVYSYYFGEIDWLKFEDNNLYLADNWHFDFEFDQVVRYNEFREVDVSPGVEYQSSVGADYFTNNSFTPIGYKIPIKLTDDVYGEFISWRYIDLNFTDVDEASDTGLHEYILDNTLNTVCSSDYGAAGTAASYVSCYEKYSERAIMTVLSLIHI